MGAVAARDLAPDLHVQVAHGVDRAEVEILAKDEGAGDAVELGPAFAQHHPRLDPGVALPLAALGDEIVFQHVEAAHQRPGVAIGAQAHVDAEHLAMFGDLVQGLDQLLAEALEKFIVADHLLATGVAIFRVDEDEVDVGGHVELASAELAHADDEQLLLPAGGRQRQAVALDEGGAQHRVRMTQADFGEHGHGFGDLRQRCGAG